MFKRKEFILDYLIGCFLFSRTFEPSLNLAKMEKSDLRLIKDQIVVLNLNDGKNILANMSEPSILDVEEISFRSFPARPQFNSYDKVENQIVKSSVMLKAHLMCIKPVDSLPRRISKKDKSVKFDKNYSGLFKKKL